MHSTLLVVAVVYGVVLRIATLAGLFGILLRIMITLSLCRYCYQVLQDVARGRSFITPPDLESTNPVGEFSLALHCVFFLLLAAMLSLMPRIIGEGAGAELIRVVGLVVVLGTFPASIAAMAMTRNLAAALNPFGLASVIGVLRARYLLLLAAIAVVAFAASYASGALTGYFAAFVAEIIGVWTLLATFALVGSALHDNAAEFGFSPVEEVRARNVETDRHRDWHRTLDIAYASIRSGFVDQGYRTIKDLIAREGDSLEVYQWTFNRMLDWHEHKYALDLAQRFVVRLVEEKRERAALDLIDQCRRLSPAFELPAGVAQPLSEYARTIGRPRLADQLAATTQR